MTLFFLIVLDILFKVLTNNTLFFFLPFLLVYFLNNYKKFFSFFFFSSLVNDLMLKIPIGFTGCIIGTFFLFLIFLKKFLNFEGKNITFLLNFLVQLVFIFSIFYILQLNSFNLFSQVFLINLLFSTFILFLYKVLF